MKKIIIFSALVFGVVGARAQTSVPAIMIGNNNPEDCERFARDDADRDKKVQACVKEKFDKQVLAEVSSLRSTCQSNVSKVSEARKKATGSCSQARIGGKDISKCISKVDECSEIQESEAENSELNEFAQSIVSQGGSLSGSAATIFESGSARAAVCPNFTSEQYETQRKAIQDRQQDLIKEAEEIEQTQKAAELKYAEEVAKVDKELKELPANLKKSKDAETAAIQEAIRTNREAEAKQEAEISKTEIEISDAIQKIADLEAKRTTELSKITDYRNRITCQNAAIELKKKLLSKPGSRSLQTGLKRSSSLKKQIENDYKTCYATLQASRREINRSFDSQIASLNKRIDVANANIANARSLRDEAKKVIQDSIAQLPVKEKEIERQFEEQRKELLRQRDAMTKEFNNGLEAAQRQLQNLQKQNAEQSRLLADLGQKPLPGAKKTTEEVSEELGNYTTVIDDAFTSCGCDADDNVTGTTNVNQAARSILKDQNKTACSQWETAKAQIDSDSTVDVPVPKPNPAPASTTKGVDGT